MKVLLLLCLGVATVTCQRRPPNYSQQDMPVTSFNCRDKIIGGYYADPETDCQMFHVCVKVPGLGLQDFKFLCPNDTSFDQENQICDDWYNIDCETSTLFYSDNFDLYRIGHEGGGAKRVRVGNVNNAVSDVEDDFYLQQKNDRGENVGKDLLRGSQSGNFFSNRGGQDEEDEAYKPKKKTSAKPARKLLTGKRPVQQEAQTTTTTTEAYTRAQNNRAFGQQGRRIRVNQEPPTTTLPAAVPDNYQQRQRSGFNGQRQQYDSQDNADYQRQRSNPSSGGPPQRTAATQQFYQGTTYRPNYFDNSRNAQAAQKSGTTTQRAYSDYQSTTQRAYSNYQSTTQKPYSYQTTQATTTTTLKPFYNNYQTTTQKPFYNNYQTTTQKAYSNYQTTTQKPFYNNYQTTTQDYFTTTQGRSTAEKANNYETEKLFKINLNAAAYEEPADEFLKTAHSQNLATSNLNRVQNSYKQLNASYNFNPVVAATTTTTQRPPSTRGRTVYQKATDATEKPRPFTTTAKAVAQPKAKEQDAAYDYAYYDDGTASEYEAVEPVEEFRRTTSRKRSA